MIEVSIQINYEAIKINSVIIKILSVAVKINCETQSFLKLINQLYHY